MRRFSVVFALGRGAPGPRRRHPDRGRAVRGADPHLRPRAAGAPASAGPPRRARVADDLQPPVLVRQRGPLARAPLRAGRPSRERGLRVTRLVGQLRPAPGRRRGRGEGERPAHGLDARPAGRPLGSARRRHQGRRDDPRLLRDDAAADDRRRAFRGRARVSAGHEPAGGDPLRGARPARRLVHRQRLERGYELEPRPGARRARERRAAGESAAEDRRRALVREGPQGAGQGRRPVPGRGARRAGLAREELGRRLDEGLVPGRRTSAASTRCGRSGAGRTACPFALAGFTATSRTIRAGR